MATRRKRARANKRGRHAAPTRNDTPVREEPTWAGPVSPGTTNSPLRTALDDRGLRLATLSTLPDVSLDQIPDVRNWPVTLADGTTIGRVARIIVDQSQEFVPRYLDVTVDAQMVASRVVPSRDLLIPIGCARIASDGDMLVLPTLTREGFDNVPLLAAGAIGLEHERMVARAFGVSSPVFDADTLYATDAFDLTALLASRRNVTA